VARARHELAGDGEFVPFFFFSFSLMMKAQGRWQLIIRPERDDEWRHVEPGDHDTG